MMDGSLAIVRARDYHMEWFGADGAHTVSPRIPFPGDRLTDDDKVRIADSVNAVAKQRYDSALAAKAADSIAGRNLTTVKLANGTTRIRSTTFIPAPRYYAPENVGDYRIAPVAAGRTTLSDRDNRLWIHVAYPGVSSGGMVYDVVNRSGALVDRVQLPEGCTLIGFGTSGTAYLVSHDAGLSRLEMARVR